MRLEVWHNIINEPVYLILVRTGPKSLKIFREFDSIRKDMYRYQESNSLTIDTGEFGYPDGLAIGKIMFLKTIEASAVRGSRSQVAHTISNLTPAKLFLLIWMAVKFQGVDIFLLNCESQVSSACSVSKVSLLKGTGSR